MNTPDRKPSAALGVNEWVDIAFATAISTLAIVYIVVPAISLLIAWQAVAIVYLILLFTVFRNRSIHAVAPKIRRPTRKLLEYLSWVLPIVASGAGIASGVKLLTTDGTNGTGSSGALLVGLLGSVSVVVAWFLLQVGFAEIYESVYEQTDDSNSIRFPGLDEGDHPTRGDFLYMSFTVGTSFAIAGATIASRKVRQVILVHSIASFFYNAFLIAVAIQVIRGIIANG